MIMNVSARLKTSELHPHLHQESVPLSVRVRVLIVGRPFQVCLLDSCARCPTPVVAECNHLSENPTPKCQSSLADKSDMVNQYEVQFDGMSTSTVLPILHACSKHTNYVSPSTRGQELPLVISGEPHHTVSFPTIWQPRRSNNLRKDHCACAYNFQC